jgi:hypothetical protein
MHGTNIKLIMFIVYLFLIAIGLTPVGSSTVYIYTQTVHRMQRTERLWDLYPGICLTTDEKARTNLN